jgi:sugar phosphate isomerase/epimerase
VKLGLVPTGTPVVTEVDRVMLARWGEMGISQVGGRLPDDLGQLDETGCREIRRRYADHGLDLCQLWVFERPLYHPDPDRRARDHAALRRALPLSRALDCPVLIVGGGSCDPGGAFSAHRLNQTEAALEGLIEGARQVVPAAADAEVYLGIEPLSLAILGTPRRARRLFDAVASPYLGVNLDPVNWMTLETVFYMAEAVDEMFDLLGERIVSAHAKDGTIEPRVLVHLSECRCGTGLMDWRVFLRRFAQLEGWKTLALEHTADADIPAALDHLRACAAAEGIALA